LRTTPLAFLISPRCENFALAQKIEFAPAQLSRLLEQNKTANSRHGSRLYGPE
jgi:hypothetical protein